jgi:hypothetical protein
MSVISPVLVLNSSLLNPPTVRMTSFPDCWEMFYQPTEGLWYLQGGGGVLLYTMSAPWRPYAVNNFDVLVINVTGQAVPNSIPVWPYSDFACNCPQSISPLAFINQNRVYPPTLTSNLGPSECFNVSVVLAPSVGTILAPTQAINLQTVRPPTVISHIAPAYFINTNTLYSPGIRGHLGPTAVVNLQTVDSPTVRKNLGPTTVVNLQTVDSPQMHTHLAPTAFTNAQTVDPPTVHVPPSFAVFVQGNAAAGSATASQSVAFTSSNTAGNALVVCVNVYLNSGTGTVSVSDSANGSYGAPAVTITNGFQICSIYVLPNCAGGSNHVTVTTSSSGNFITVNCLEYSGVLTASPVDATHAGSAATSSPQAGPITTVAAGDLIVGCFAAASTSITVTSTPSGWTSRPSINGSPAGTLYLICEDYGTGSSLAAGTYTGVWTTSTVANYTSCAVALKT